MRCFLNPGIGWRQNRPSRGVCATMLGRLISLLAFLLLTACALIPPSPPPPPADPIAAHCLDLYAAVDKTVANDGVTPSSPARIAGFPYLRVNRFLASYRDEPMDAAGRAAWVARLAELDRQARQVELESLPGPVLEDLTHGAALDACAQTLQAYLLASPQHLGLVRERAVVPPDYRTLNRVLGLYPLLALPVSYGIFRWHEETHRVFALPLEALPVRGKLRRWRPPGEAVEIPPFTELSRDALGIPEPTPAPLADLYAAHAPVWEIDVVGNFDLPGTPFWRNDGIPSVDPSVPVTYRYATYTRWQGRVLLQLNYLIWFAERPLTGLLDIYGGALDGLIWRVTLDHDGTPLLYDSIHPCGCYHLFFPGPGLRLRPTALALPEPPLVPQWAPLINPDTRVIVRMASGNHFIQRVYTAVPEEGSVYAWRDYQELYSVPVMGDDQRSLFGLDGLVPGTERRERWLLWPMGIPSAGAMRERGRHATAFIGRRHFDDPDLLERLFEPVGFKL